MVELVKKKLGKLIGLKKEVFNDFIRAKEISVVRPRLIPLYKVGDEMALTSVLLSSLRLVNEYKKAVFSDAKIMRGGKAYFYTEVCFKDFKESRIDGLILIVKSGIIKDAAILEVKNGRDKLGKEQLEQYQSVARHYAIQKFITVSNEFVTEPTQLPVSIRKLKSLEMYHFSWSYLLTIAHVLLYKNNINIADEDQVEIMREVVQYFESDKVGVFGFNKMSPSWTEVVDKITKGEKLSVNGLNVIEAARSWQQQERDMALRLSRSIGSIVDCGESKYKGNLSARLADDSKSIVTTQQIGSVFKVKDAASDIKVDLQLGKRTIEMFVALKVPENKTIKGQIGWLKRQLDTAIKKNPLSFEQVAPMLMIEPKIKGARNSDRISVGKFERLYELLKGQELREFRLVYIKDFGAKFAQASNFVKLSDTMLSEFYKAVVQHLVKWEPEAPKIKQNNQKPDEESFIEKINSGELDEPSGEIVTDKVAVSNTANFFSGKVFS